MILMKYKVLIFTYEVPATGLAALFNLGPTQKTGFIKVRENDLTRHGYKLTIENELGQVKVTGYAVTPWKNNDLNYEEPEYQ